MALKPRYRAFVRPFRTCSWQDPAIDVASSDMDEFRKDHDPAHIRMMPGEDPTWVELVAISQDELALIREETYSTNRRVQLNQISSEVFRVGCVGFEHLLMLALDDDGIEKEVPVRFVLEMLPGRCKRLPDHIVRAFGAEAVDEFADVILMLSHLGDQEKKASLQPISSTTSKQTGSTATTADTSQD